MIDFRKAAMALIATCTAVAGPLLLVLPAQAASLGDTVEYKIKTGSEPSVMVTGPDGNLWFTEYGRNKVAKITPTGTITEYSVPTANANPSGIAVGSDGNIWYTEDAVSKIARISLAGVSTEFPLGGGSFKGAEYVTSGPDGNLWVTEGDGGHVDRVTTAGVVTRFDLSATSLYMQGIASAHGLIWVAEGDSGKIATLTTAGVVTQHTLPLKGLASTGGLDGMGVGPDGNVWFGLDDRDRIATVDSTFHFTYFTLPANTGAEQITTGPDGNLWFTESRAGDLGRITTAGVHTSFPVPSTKTAGFYPQGITSGPDCQVWYTGTNTSSGKDRIGRIVVNLPAVSGVSPSTGPAVGGTSVTITGVDFYNVAAVTFGGKPATSYSRTGCNSITATAPAGAGTVDVVVTANDGLTQVSAADQFTYQVPVTVPRAGAGVARVTPVSPSPAVPAILAVMVVMFGLARRRKHN